MKVYKKLEDSYEDIHGACIDTLKDSEKIGFTAKQSILRYIEDFDGAYEEYELEWQLMMISLGVFAVENNSIDDLYLYRIKNAIFELKINSFEDSLSRDDILLLNKHIEFLNKALNKKIRWFYLLYNIKQ